MLAATTAIQAYSQILRSVDLRWMAPMKPDLLAGRSWCREGASASGWGESMPSTGFPAALNAAPLSTTTDTRVLNPDLSLPSQRLLFCVPFFFLDLSVDRFPPSSDAAAC
jgi:hypothetical protein